MNVKEYGINSMQYDLKDYDSKRLTDHFIVHFMHSQSYNTVEALVNTKDICLGYRKYCKGDVILGFVCVLEALAISD